MTEESREKKSGERAGAAFLKSSTDDRKIISGATPGGAAIPTASPTKMKVTIKSADMKEDMQKEAIDRALMAFEKHSVEKDIAAYIKKEFDKKYGPTWHCIVGRNFGGGDEAAQRVEEEDDYI